jgi:YbgC/YbaW family acyl-CoA thioester hydrolase
VTTDLPGLRSSRVDLAINEPTDLATAEYVTTHLVSMIDVDAAQIHYSSYVRWMDIGVNALLIAIGLPIRAILEAGLSFPVVDLHCSYHAPVVLGDVLTCRSYFTQPGRTSIKSRHEFSSAGVAVATGTITHVWTVPTDGVLKPSDLPVKLLSAVRS